MFRAIDSFTVLFYQHRKSFNNLAKNPHTSPSVNEIKIYKTLQKKARLLLNTFPIKLKLSQFAVTMSGFIE